MRSWMVFAATLISLAACDSSTGPGGRGNVAVRFSTAPSPRLLGNVVATDAKLAADQLTLTGTNGTLVIDDIRFIVEEMELRSSDVNSACEDDNAENEHDNDVLTSGNGLRNDADGNDSEDECEFEGGPFVVDLPLEGNTTVTTENVPAGTYDSFKFKIDDLEGDDEDEADDRARVPNALGELRTVYPNFPSRASMVVKGTENGQPFIVYFRAKLRISEPISPALVVPGNQVLTVKIDPSAWFKNGNQLLDLVSLNGRLVELGDGFSAGVKGAERDD